MSVMKENYQSQIDFIIRDTRRWPYWPMLPMRRRVDNAPEELGVIVDCPDGHYRFFRTPRSMFLDTPKWDGQNWMLYGKYGDMTIDAGAMARRLLDMGWEID